jgi:hypothetical protein
VTKISLINVHIVRLVGSFQTHWLCRDMALSRAAGLRHNSRRFPNTV